MSNPLDAVLGNAPAPEEIVTPEAEVETPDIPEVIAEAAPPPPSPPPPEPGHVPISAMLDEREKRQALERRLAEMEATREPAEPLPLEAQMEHRLYAMNLQTSKRFAETQYGAEQVAKVHDWAAARCDADPIFNQQMRASDHPYESAMQAFNREQILAEVTPSRLEAFKAWEAAQAGIQAHSPTPTSQTPSAPKSLVNAPGNGATGRSTVQQGEGSAFGAFFTPQK